MTTEVREAVSCAGTGRGQLFRPPQAILAESVEHPAADAGGAFSSEAKRRHRRCTSLVAGVLPETDDLIGGVRGRLAGGVSLKRRFSDGLARAPTSLVTVHGNSRLLAKAVAGAVWRQDL